MIKTLIVNAVIYAAPPMVEIASRAAGREVLDVPDRVVDDNE